MVFPCGNFLFSEEIYVFYTNFELNFFIPGRLEPVFKDLDIRLDTSWKLALVGDNGKGKTTLLKLLAARLKRDGRGLGGPSFPPFSV